MEALLLPLATVVSSMNSNTIPLSHARFCEFRQFRTKPIRKICAFSVNSGNNSSNGEEELDKWDLMELKFGQMMGEDPNLTRAKIMGRKSDPNVSYLEVEKSFYKKKGKARIIEEVPFGDSEEKKPSISLNGLNLVRPVPKKGVKFEIDTKPIKSRIKLPSEQVKKPVNTKGTVPNVILRKPTVFSEDDIGLKGSSKMSIKPNLLLRMGREQTKENFTDMTLLLKKPETMSTYVEKEQELNGQSEVAATNDLTEKNLTDTALLKKPEPVINNSNCEKEQDLSGETKIEATNDLTKEQFIDIALLKKPAPMIRNSNHEKEQELSGETKGKETNELTSLTQRPQLKQMDLDNSDLSNSSYNFNANSEGTNSSPDSGERSLYVDPEVGENSRDFGSDDLFGRGPQQSDEESAEEPNVPLIGKPNRLDQTTKVTGNLPKEQTAIANTELDMSATSPIKEFEENDWRKAEDLIQTSGRDDVELVSASTRGFVVSFGSLIGFLPYRNLSPRWKFIAFESWLRGKGLDPSKYKHNLGVIGNNGILDETSPDMKISPEKIDEKVDADISPDLRLDDLLRIYDQEKLVFLSSFVGQKLKVNVTLADRKTRRLIFSLKPKEKEEMIDKKRTLMAKLSVGDVVKCQIKKITYFGIFVEVEGVPALIHQTEVSWDATLDPASYYKVGQIVEAKVHQLDFSLRRIFLSLKEITPDPLTEALEAVIGDKDYLDGKLEPAQNDEEWADVEILIKELQQFEGIESVSKGRFFLSPGLAPTFQVYMASMFENEYKLLARAGNKVQEVIVQTSLGKEDMKSAILTCTNRVK